MRGILPVLRRVVNAAPVAGSVAGAQLTDVYLLGLARKHGGFLATFDRPIPLKAAGGARPDDLVVIEA